MATTPAARIAVASAETTSLRERANDRPAASSVIGWPKSGSHSSKFAGSDVIERAVRGVAAAHGLAWIIGPAGEVAQQRVRRRRRRLRIHRRITPGARRGRERLAVVEARDRGGE